MELLNALREISIKTSRSQDDVLQKLEALESIFNEIKSQKPADFRDGFARISRLKKRLDVLTTRINDINIRLSKLQQ